MDGILRMFALSHQQSQLMKKSLLLALLTFLLTNSATAQSRNFGAQRLLLDNGLGTGTMTLEYNGVGDQTLDVDDITPLPTASADQTLRHNGTAWEATSVLQTTATGVITNGAVFKSVVKPFDPLVYFVSETEHVILIEDIGGVQLIILPVPVAGREITIRMIGNPGIADVIPNGAELINGSSSYDLSGADNYVTLICDGTDWWSISHF